MSKITYIYAYLHGFCSNNSSDKGSFMKDTFLGTKDEVLHLLNLNRDPHNDASTSIKKGFEELNLLYKREFSMNPSKTFKFRLIGSSLGAYTAALYATEYKDRVESLFLMCPAFNLRSKLDCLAAILSPSMPANFKDILNLWKTMGHLPFKQPNSNQSFMIPYSFVEELENVEKYPKYKCRTLILAGTLDVFITIDDIKDFLNQNEEQKHLTKLITVEDDHSLMRLDTLCLIKKLATEFFE